MQAATTERERQILSHFTGLRRRASRQNQDLRDYRIFRILPTRVFDGRALVRIRLGGIPVTAKSASWAKRNPANPDSDKDAGLDSQAIRPKSSPNSNRRLPLSIYGLQGAGFGFRGGKRPSRPPAAMAMVRAAAARRAASRLWLKDVSASPSRGEVRSRRGGARNAPRPRFSALASSARPPVANAAADIASRLRSTLAASVRRVFPKPVSGQTRPC